MAECDAVSFVFVFCFWAVREEGQPGDIRANKGEKKVLYVLDERGRGDGFRRG